MNGLQIIELRKNLNLTQDDLAKMMGVTRRTVANWESGTRIPPSMQNLLEKISQTKENVTEEEWHKEADNLTRVLTMMENDRKFYSAIIERTQSQVDKAQQQIDRSQYEIDRLIGIIENRQTASDKKRTSVA